MRLTIFRSVNSGRAGTPRSLETASLWWEESWSMSVLWTIKVEKLKPVMKASNPARWPPQFIVVVVVEVFEDELGVGESEVSPLLLWWSLLPLVISIDSMGLSSVLIRFRFRSFLLIFASLPKTTWSMSWDWLHCLPATQCPWLEKEAQTLMSVRTGLNKLS